MLADKVKAELDSKAPAVQAARRKFDAARAAAQKEVPVEKLLDMQSAEFQALDAVHKEYTTAAQEFETLKATYRELEAMDGAGKFEAVAEGLRNDVGNAEQFIAAGMPVGVVTRAAKAVTGAAEYRALLEAGVLQGNGGIGGKRALAREATSRDELKAALRGAFRNVLVTGAGATQGGALTVNDRQAGIIGLPVRPLTITDLITIGQTDSDLVEYVRQTARPTGAAFVAEAATTDGSTGRKPESGLALEVVTTNVKTAAHWIPATRRALADAGQLRTLIEQGLEYGLNEEIEDQLVNGNGTGENLLGFMNAGGISTYARDLGGAGTADDESRLDALHKGITLVRLQNVEPTAIGQHPNDWQETRLEKDANGNYKLGPANAQVDQQVFGLPVAVSAAFVENTSVVANFALAMTLWLRAGVSFYVTDSNRDWFELNILAILAEMRVAAGVTQPRAICTVTNM